MLHSVSRKILAWDPLEVSRFKVSISVMVPYLHTSISSFLPLTYGQALLISWGESRLADDLESFVTIITGVSLKTPRELW